MQKTKFKIRGTAPLLMHNGQLTNPMNDHAVRLAHAVKVAKNKKTAAAWADAYQIEFEGGLYLNEKGEPCIPGEVIEATICGGARKMKQGKSAKAGLMVVGQFALKYDGPRDPGALWKKKFYLISTVKIGKNRVMRTRPMFNPGWECEFTVEHDPRLVAEKDICSWLAAAGAEDGICDYRPRYGRFEVVS